MSYIDTTFERGGQVVKTLAKVYGGWDSTKKGGNRFYDWQLIDWRGDIRLSVKVWMGRMQLLDLESPGLVYDHSPEFPLDLTAQFNDGQLTASIANGRVSIAVILSKNLPWIFTSNKKWAIDWGPKTIAQHRGQVYELRHMIVFNLPAPKIGDSWERDLLPFLPGGLVERNRRKH